MKELWRYYVPNNQISFDSFQPMIVEGGRGTGKTTLFMCNCWREKSAKDKNSGGNGISSILADGYVGLYYKIDPVFVSALNNDYFSEKKEGVFNTYFALEIIKELLGFLRQVEKTGQLPIDVVKAVSRKFYSTIWNREGECHDIHNMQVECDKALDAVESALNFGIQDGGIYPRWTLPGSIVNEIISALKEFDIFSNIGFKIYVDEYESLSIWQQKSINTLLKRSNSNVVYNIGVKPKGMKTFETLAENECLQKTHDYQYFCLDSIIAVGYDEMLREICEKRLQLFRAENLSTGIGFSTDIEDYLGRYSIEEELKRFSKKTKPVFYNQLHELIKKETDDATICDDLCDRADPFYARLHLCLLLRNKKYKPKIEDLWQGYKDRVNEVDSKYARSYQNWEHNAKNGIVFLLAKDYHVQKWYYGFDTMVALSSGIVRYFLELCEQLFSVAIQNGFEWGSSCFISPELQTRAAQYVSRRQIMELETLACCGKQLKIFTLSLGTLFRDLHRNDNLTLGEPEPNHFSINALSKIEKPVYDALGFALRNSVLQELPQTKEKEVIHTNNIDYHLNKIFAPYFEISCLRKRKIEIESQVLSALFSNDEEIAKKAVKSYLIDYWKNKTQLHSEGYEQLTIFDLEGN